MTVANAYQSLLWSLSWPSKWSLPLKWKMPLSPFLILPIPPIVVVFVVVVVVVAAVVAHAVVLSFGKFKMGMVFDGQAVHWHAHFIFSLSNMP